MATMAAANDAEVSRNLNGQRLGRKGRDTRARILAVAAEIVSEAAEPVTLSAVARGASLGMTSLYLYFSDLTELLLALLQPVSDSAEDAYVHLLRSRWPDEDLGASCRKFVAAHHGYWSRHSPLLHLRNSMADAHDLRMMEHRIAAARPVIRLLAMQMDADATRDLLTPTVGMASLLMTSLERAATIWTDPKIHRMFDSPEFSSVDRVLIPAARLLEMGIRDGRAQMGAAS